MQNATSEDIRRVEEELSRVYDFCPPTRTMFASEDAREEYKRFWGAFFGRLGVPPSKFHGARVLDAGCGSCEKAAFYHDWGGKVTGIDLSAEVLAHGRASIGQRDIELINGSLFDLDRAGQYDIAVIDGVSFVTADTFKALGAVARQLKPSGVLVFSLTNVWGHFWWFRFARMVTGMFGGDDFHRRAEIGRKLFGWTRESQEGTGRTAGFYRSDQSWAYDWFGPPAYHLHSPGQIRRELANLGLEITHSIPGLITKDPPVGMLARVVRALTGGGPAAMGLYWLANRAPNMVYVAASRRATS